MQQAKLVMVSISIIIPIYNTEPYIRRCLESVMAQDAVGADVECILVDDCGQDRSMDVVSDMLSSYQGAIRFRIVSHTRNMGLSMARNTGVQAATGDYVLFVDSDDHLASDALSYMVNHLQRYPGVDVVVGNTQNVKDGNLLQTKWQEPVCIDNPTVSYRMMLRRDINHYAWNKLIRRQLLSDHQILFIKGIIYEDSPWTYRLFTCADSVLLLPQVTYVYEDNPASIVNTTYTAENAETAVRSYTIAVNDVLDHPPVAGRYHDNVTVDYLLYACYVLMKGVDLTMNFSLPDSVARDFRMACWRLMRRSLRSGRLLLSLFFCLLFTPLNQVQRLRFFRHNYQKIERLVCSLAHLTDFLHSKNHQR